MSASDVSPFDVLLRMERISHAADTMALGAGHPHLQSASDNGTRARDAISRICATTKARTTREILMLAALAWEAGSTIECVAFADNFRAAMGQIVDHIGGSPSDVEAARRVDWRLPSSFVPMVRPDRAAVAPSVFDLLDDAARLADEISALAAFDPAWRDASNEAVGVVADLRKACAFEAPRNSRDALMQIASAYAVSDYVLPEADNDAKALRAALTHVAAHIAASAGDFIAAGRIDWRLALGAIVEPHRAAS